MSQQQSAHSELHISDPLEFARREQRLEREVPVSMLPRYAAGLVGAEQVPVRFEVRGEWVSNVLGNGGQAFLVLDIHAEPTLRCQRCLSGLSLPLDIASRLLLVPPGREMPDEDLEEDDFDPIAAEPDLNVLALVEDELLLALPLAPRHENCDTPHPRVEDDSASPFAALAKLRGAGNK